MSDKGVPLIAKARSSQARKVTQKGMALIAAMVTVLVVALLASSALWIQSNRFEVESSQRQRNQALWLLTGALDWSRVILREDARSSTTDTLVEPWAVPLQEAKLSSFIRAQSNATGSTASDNTQDEALTEQVFLSGQITDVQSKLNFYNLLLAANVSLSTLNPVSVTGTNAGTSAPESNTPSAGLNVNSASTSNATTNAAQGVAMSFIRLFQVLQLPVNELEAVNAQLKILAQSQNANRRGGNPLSSSSALAMNGGGPLMPQRFEQLTWLGLSESSVRQLLPHATWVPFSTAVNLNTATTEVIYAQLLGLDYADAQRLVKARENKPWQSMEQFKQGLSSQSKPISYNESTVQLSSRLFEVRGQLRMGQTTITEKSLLLRDNSTVQIVWRDRGAALRFLDAKVP
jgi:general secretion pathway protein K